MHMCTVVQPEAESIEPAIGKFTGQHYMSGNNDEATLY